MHSPGFDALSYRVDWPYLRIWAESRQYGDAIQRCPLKNYAYRVGASMPGDGKFELRERRQRATTSSWHGWINTSTTVLTGSDTMDSAANALATAITANQADGSGECGGQRHDIELDLPRRAGLEWKPDRRVRDGAAERARNHGRRAAARFAGGEISGALEGGTQFLRTARRDRRAGTDHACAEDAVDVGGGPAGGNFERSEFAVAVTNWRVSGDEIAYSVAGTGSRRIEDDAAVAYEGLGWKRGEITQGGSIRWTDTPGARE